MEKSKDLSILDEFKVLFEKKDYQKAADFLHKHKDKFETGVFDYNLGLVYLKNNQFVKARVSLEKAKINGFYSNEVQAALSEVTESLDVKMLEEPTSFSDSFNSIVLQVPFDAYVFVTLFFVTISIATYKKFDKYIRLIIFVLGLLPTVFYFQHVNQHEKIIVLEDEYVYRGPSKMFEQIQIIPKGMKLFTGKNYNGWRYIVTPTSHQGWFTTNKVKSL